MARNAAAKRVAKSDDSRPKLATATGVARTPRIPRQTRHAGTTERAGPRPRRRNPSPSMLPSADPARHIGAGAERSERRR